MRITAKLGGTGSVGEVTTCQPSRSGRHAPRPGQVIDTVLVTRSNVRLFTAASTLLSASDAKLPFAGSPFKGSHDETHVSAIEGPPCADARVPRPDENRRRPEGPVGAPRQGPRAPDRLTPPRSAQRAGGAASYRLRGTGVFEAIFKTGARHDAHFLQLIAAPAAASPGRVGYVIGRKAMRRAVDRNRLRRRLRESVRAARPAIEAFDIILRVKRTIAASAVGAANLESRQLLALLVSRR